jgi:hypothetical protein
MNKIIRVILNDDTIRLGWAGRNSVNRLTLHRNGEILIPSLDALSAGQTSLLNLFGTLVRYGDMAPSNPPPPVSGICLIDEIDAHMHVDLQNIALPKLIKMFPHVQFIVSSHSPLFVLGMEREFSPSGMQILELPSGNLINAEEYREFGRALQVFKDTTTFAAEIAALVNKPGKILVLVEGETDPTYLNTAVAVFERTDIAANVEFAWIGAKDTDSGQGFHTGKDALNGTFTTLRAKPELRARPIVLLYDNDTNKRNEDCGNLHIRVIPTNNENLVVQAGIENLLPETVFTTEMYETKTTKQKNGSEVTRVNLNKMRLCRKVCSELADRDHFRMFGPLLDMIAEIAVRYQVKS